MRNIGLIAVIGMGMITAFALHGQAVPTTINYQGRLTDNSPSQIPVNATVPMGFAIWNAATIGTKLWNEPASGGANVLVINGIFNYVLGSSVAIPGATFTGASSARYLEITINPGAGNQEILSPRQLITASGYANLAENANSITGTLPVARGGTGANLFTTGGAGQYVKQAGTGAAFTVGAFPAGDISSGSLDVARMPVGGAWALSSNLNIDANTLVVDQANSRVGIGTAAPEFPLEVNTALGNTNARFGASNPLYLISSSPHVGFNAFYNGGWFYGSTNYAGILGFNTPTGTFNLGIAPSGIGGAGAPLTDRLTISATGVVSVPSPGTLSVGVIRRTCTPMYPLTDCACNAGETVVTGGGYANGTADVLRESEPLSTTTWRTGCFNTSFGSVVACGGVSILCSRLAP